MFKLHAENMASGHRTYFTYNPHTSELRYHNGALVVPHVSKKWNSVQSMDIDQPIIGKTNLRRVKIQLGLSCNYECNYCSQKAVPRADETTKKEVDPFLELMPSWFDGGPTKDGDKCRIEFWGGEPFAYWKTMKPLVERIRVMYPKATLSVITNGSLLTKEKLDWMKSMNFSFAISHDGPGQHVRGPDPLDDPEMLEVWRYAKQLFPGRMSFSATLNSANFSRKEIDAWFVERFGDDVRIGEGSYAGAYHEDGADDSFTAIDIGKKYARNAFSELRDGSAEHFAVSKSKRAKFLDSLRNQRPSTSLSQKCGMESRSSVAVDLKGNVMTCQNVSAVATSTNGASHNIGHVTSLDTVALNTSTHWSKRENCSNCPVLQLCQGDCMFVHGPLFDASCETAYYDNIAHLADALEYITGYALVYIEGGSMPDRRRDPFDLAPKKEGSEAAEPKPKAKKIIPIKAV